MLKQVWVFTAVCYGTSYIVAVTDYDPEAKGRDHLWELLERYLRPDGDHAADHRTPMGLSLDLFAESDFQVCDRLVLTMDSLS